MRLPRVHKGHYKPTETQLVAMLRYLRHCGFDLSTFECWVYSPDKAKANYSGNARYDRKVAQVRRGQGACGSPCSDVYTARAVTPPSPLLIVAWQVAFDEFCQNEVTRDNSLVLFALFVSLAWGCRGGCTPTYTSRTGCDKIDALQMSFIPSHRLG